MSLAEYQRNTLRTITHTVLELPVDWLEFKTQRLNSFNAPALAAATTLAEPFSIYAMYDHGELSTLAGQPRKAKQYVMGNSRVANTMTIHDIRAAQSVPISNLVHETRPGYTTVEFESAASMFTALTDGNEEVAKVGAQINQLRESVFLKVFNDIKAGRVGGNGL